VLNAANDTRQASTLWDHPHVMLLGTAIVAACLVCNRIYRGLAHRYKGLETHYEFVSSVVRSTDLSEITASVLTSARKLLRANEPCVAAIERWRRAPGACGSAGRPRWIGCAGAPQGRRAPCCPGPCHSDAGAAAPPWLRSRRHQRARAHHRHRPFGGRRLVVTQAKRNAVAVTRPRAARLSPTRRRSPRERHAFQRLEHEAADRAHQATHDR
jgi:hypothetical protein